MGGHIVSKCKKDEFEGVGVTNFGFIEEIPDFLSGHEFIGKKARPSRDSVLELWSSEASCSERDSIFCISAFKKAVLTICW